MDPLCGQDKEYSDTGRMVVQCSMGRKQLRHLFVRGEARECQP